MIILLVFFGLLIGSFPALIVWCNCDETRKVRRVILTILVGVLVGFIAVGAMCLDSKIENDTWNNGVCPTCEVKWDFVNGSKAWRQDTTYFYECPNCNKIIEQNYLR